MKDIVLLGDRNSQFLTHRELDAAISLLPNSVRARWVDTDSPEASCVAHADALWVVPGSPYRNDAAVYSAIETARASQASRSWAPAPVFNTRWLSSLGTLPALLLPAMRRQILRRDNLVVDRLTCSLVGQERSVTAVPGTRMYDLCGGEPFIGFHWCNYGLAPAYADRLISHGLVIAARAEDAGAEAIELPDHPFFLATLFQPQIGSIDRHPLHPIIKAFASAP